MSDLLPDNWEMIIGLECHVELATNTKLFCSCANRFGDEPNTNTCPVCLALPGSLPVLNEQAVELAIRLGTALNCTVKPSIFHRKNYFYPDMPKDYQTSQYDQPINEGGHLEIASGKTIGITRAHLEEDTGKSNHIGGTGRIAGASHSLVDYNRAGVPLLEIVSEADIRTAEEARQYIAELRSIILAVEASDAKMEEGSMRVDANVSVHELGTPWGTRCEIKNLNSLRSLGRAIEYEARRQVDVLHSGGKIRQETRHWDENTGRTGTLRIKEEAEDYRYFPEPDLVPVVPSAQWLARVAAAQPMLPAERRGRLAAAVGVEHTSSSVAIVVDRALDELVLASIAAGGDAVRSLTHAEHNLAIDGAGLLAPAALAGLTKLEVSGSVTATQAKQILAELVEAGGQGDPAAIAKSHGFEAMDTSVLDAAVDAAIAANAKQWDEFVAGNDKVAGFFVGAVMRATGGKADGKAVTAALNARKG